MKSALVTTVLLAVHASEPEVVEVDVLPNSSAGTGKPKNRFAGKFVGLPTPSLRMQPYSDWTTSTSPPAESSRAVDDEKAPWISQDPAAWSTLYPTCAGRRQSPIDLQFADARNKETTSPITFNYDTLQTSDALVENTRHDLKVDIMGKARTVNTMTGAHLAGKKYVLEQLRFNWGEYDAQGSAHNFNGQAFPMEMHMVHYLESCGSVADCLKANLGDGLAVYGVMFEIGGDDNSALDDLFDRLVTEVRYPGSTKMDSLLDLNLLLPAAADTEYISYMGSLTTPPCSQTVRWTMAANKLRVSKAQMVQLRSLMITYNNRRVQALNGRTATSSWSSTAGMEVVPEVVPAAAAKSNGAEQRHAGYLSSVLLGFSGLVALAGI